MAALLLPLFLLQAKTEIALLHRPPKSVPAARAFVVSGQMVGASEVEHAEIRFRKKGEGAFEKVELELKEGEDYEGVIPAQEVAQGILEYYVVAFDFLGKSRDVFASAKRPQRVIVESAEAPLPPDVPETPKPDGPKPDAPKPEPAPVAAITATEPDRFTFDAADLAAMAVTTLAELLERVPELSVSRDIDGHYRLARAGMRDDAGVAVFLDGQPLGSLTMGAPDLRLPTSTLDRVEIVLASAHATDVQGTVATIRLTSRRAQVAVRAMGGGYTSHTTGEPSKTIGTYDAAVVGGGGTDRFHAYGRAYAHFSGGAQLVVGEDALRGTAVTLAPGLTNDRALRIQAGLTLDAKLTEKHVLTIDTDFLRLDHGGYAGAYDVFVPTGGRETNLARLIAALHGTLGANISYRAAVGYRLSLGALTNDVVPPGYTVPDRTGDGMIDRFADGVRDRFQFIEHGIDVDASLEAPLGKWQTLSGRFVLAQHVAGGSRFLRNATIAGVAAPLDANDLPQPPANGLSRSHIVVGVADVITPARWVALDIGARFSVMSDLGLQAGDLGALLTPVGSVTFKPLAGLELKLSYDTTVRAPTVPERFSPPPFDGHGVLGNAALRYSSARTAAFDASYVGAVGPIRYRADVRAYYSGARGQIVPLVQDATGDQLGDIQTIDAAGIMGFLRAGFATHSYVRAGMSWHRAIASVQTTPGTTLLTDTPQLAAVVSALVEIGPWLDVMLTVTHYTERRSDARTPSELLRPFRIPAQTVAAAQVRSRSFSGVRFVGMAQNAFDSARVDDVPRPDLVPGLVPREGLRLMGGIEFSLDEMRGPK